MHGVFPELDRGFTYAKIDFRRLFGRSVLLKGTFVWLSDCCSVKAHSKKYSEKSAINQIWFEASVKRHKSVVKERM